MVRLITHIESTPITATLYSVFKGAIALVDSEFPEGNKPEAVNAILCTGTELSVVYCQIIIEGSESCGQFEDAGVVCQGKFQNLVTVNIIVTWSLCRS